MSFPDLEGHHVVYIDPTFTLLKSHSGIQGLGGITLHLGTLIQIDFIIIS